MSKQLVFIDDSGDPGLTKYNTPHFVIGAVVLVNQESLDRLSLAIDGFRAGLGWKESHEFKFNSTKKSIIKDLLRFISRLDFTSYAIVVNKARITGMPELSSGENLYYYTIKELLLRLKLSDVEIIIDGVADKKQIQRARTYLRQALKQNGTEKCKIGFADSRKQPLIQLAEI